MKIKRLLAAIIAITIIVAIPTEMIYAEEASKYEPANIMITPGGIISWINPSAELTAVSVYEEGKNGYELLADDLPAISSAAVSYTYNKSFTERQMGYFLLRFDFADKNVREIYVSGELRASFISAPRFDDSGKLYLQNLAAHKQEGCIITEESYDGIKDNKALRIRSNEPTNYTDFKARIWLEAANTIPTGKYTISFRAKSTDDCSMILSEAEIKRATLAISKSDDWTEYSITAAFLNGTKNNFRLSLCEFQGELLIDDINIENEEGTNFISVNFESPSIPSELNPPIDKGSFGSVYSAVLNWEKNDYASYTRVYEKVGDELFLRARLPVAKTSVTIGNLEANREYTFVLTSELTTESSACSAFETTGTEVRVTPILPDYEARTELKRGEDVVNSLDGGSSYTAYAYVRNNHLNTLSGQMIAILYKNEKFYKSWVTELRQVEKNTSETITIPEISIPGDDNLYELQIMLWDDIQGNMKTLSDLTEYVTLSD